MIFVGGFAVENDPQINAEVLSSIPQYKALVCLMEKIHVFSTLCSERRYSAVGHELNVNE